MSENKVPPVEAGTQQRGEVPCCDHCEQPERPPTERERTIAKLRAFADWLEANPEIPAPQIYGEQYSICGLGDDGTMVELRRVAALLDVEVKEYNPGWYRVDCVAPGGMRYQVIGATKQGDANYAEEQAAAEAVRKAREEKAAEPAWFDADEPRFWTRRDEDAGQEPGIDVRTVSSEDGKIWVRDADGWRWRDGASAHWSWPLLLQSWGPLTEVVPPAQDGAR